MPLCWNAYDYDYVTDFEICGCHKSTKIQITRERNIFSSNKETLSTHQGLLYDKNSFVEEVTFKNKNSFVAEVPFKNNFSSLI